MAKGKTKTKGVNLPVPQSRDEAAAAIRAIGEDQRELLRIEADMNDALTRIKEEAEHKAAPVRERLEAATEGLKVWAEANRAALTNGNKVKFAELGTGKISWRARPASVSLRKIEEIIARLKAVGLQRFLRVKEEVNKEAMLAEPDVARTVPGVSIGSEGEDFIVEPFAAELAGGA